MDNPNMHSATQAAGPEAGVLVVVPCLNEARHIGPLLDHLLADPALAEAQVVVADGGSQDGTRAIVAAASSPLTSGMRTSMSTTSGLSRATSRTAAAPSAASPTTWRSGCALSSAPSPCRTIA